MKNKNKKIEKYKKEESHVYVFHNIRFDFNLYINAVDAEQAYHLFDACQFTNRSEWKIMLELSNQPTN